MAGKQHGRMPFGWQAGPNGYSIPNDDEQAVIVLILNMADHSAARIAARVNELGYRNRAGRPYARNQIHRIRRRVLVEESARRGAARLLGLE